MTTPAEEYGQRLERRRAERRRWARLSARVSYSRLAVFGAAVLMLVAAINGLLSPWLLSLPALIFGVLVHVHERIIGSETAAQRAIAFYERGFARIEDRWAGTGATGERFLDERHLYATDLDLFGRASLFQLLSVAATPAGEETLAQWLKEPAALDEILARQDVVKELTPALDLRESLGRAAIDVNADVHTETLLRWAEQPAILAPPILRWIARMLTAATVVAVAVFFTTGLEIPLLTALAVQSVFVWTRWRQIEHVLHGAEAVTRDLDTLARLLLRLEIETFTSPRLRHLQSRLTDAGVPASIAIRRLHRLAEVQEWRHNLMFGALAAAFLVGTHLAWAIEGWRARHGRHIRQWLGAVGEFEAFASLSAYRYEHPDDTFPIVAAAGEGAAHFEGTSLGHPLLPETRSVRNDVRLDGHTRLLIVSGSNMSGKSTLLRTVGINAVLAFAGSPVRAAGLRLSLLSIGATLRIQDSLQEGRSRFYAEITRIRELADLARGPRPLLFLLDELFHGTNSHDRLVGASGVVRSLIDRGAIGLITTHDLALTAIADRLAGRARNVHFEEWFDGSEMGFDYRVKPGPVTRSNALALMRAVGLEVDADG